MFVYERKQTQGCCHTRQLYWKAHWQGASGLGLKLKREKWQASYSAGCPWPSWVMRADALILSIRCLDGRLPFSSSRLVEPAWLWYSQSRTATPLDIEKYGIFDFSPWKYKYLVQNRPKSMMAHSEVELGLFSFQFYAMRSGEPLYPRCSLKLLARVSGSFVCLNPDWLRFWIGQSQQRTHLSRFQTWEICCAVIGSYIFK